MCRRITCQSAVQEQRHREVGTPLWRVTRDDELVARVVIARRQLFHAGLLPDNVLFTAAMLEAS